MADSRPRLSKRYFEECDKGRRISREISSEFVPDEHWEFTPGEAEYFVYLNLLERLSSTWKLIPLLELHLPGYRQEREIDFLLLHPDSGIFIVEVKSFPILVQDGRFFYADSGKRVKTDPEAQVNRQRSLLAERLKQIDEYLHNKITRVVASPAIVSFGEGPLPESLVAEQIWGPREISEPELAIQDLLKAMSYSMPIGDEIVEAIIEELCPSTTFEFSPAGLREGSRLVREQRLASQIAAMATLHVNTRVLVTGGAGSGKTQLALEWARQRADAGDDVLVTCYNDPLSMDMRQSLRSRQGRIVVNSFLRLLEEHLRPSTLHSTVDTQPYWDELVDDAERRIGDIPLRFDTIVVDEAQDFSDRWLKILAMLTKDPSSLRLLTVGDPAQDVRGTGFLKRLEDASYSRGHLPDNNRNAEEVAQFMSWLTESAAQPSNADLYSDGVLLFEVASLDAAVDSVRSVLDPGSAPQQDTWVITTSPEVRDVMRKALNFGTWEDARAGKVAGVCETARRIKGLDVSRVVLLSFNDGDNPELDKLLYTAAGRATDSLVIVASEDVVAHLPPAQ